MKSSRREFLKTTGISLVGSAVFMDPFLHSIASLAEIPTQLLVDQFSHSCEICRAVDFLYFRYYFINLKPRGKSLVRNNLSQEAYVIVRLPQQHIAEEVHHGTGRATDWSFASSCEVNFPKNASDNFSESFISGYSYLTFKLKNKEKEIEYTQRALLNWNSFDLLTLDDLSGYPKDIPVRLLANYPLNEHNFPVALAVAQINNIILPVTLFEVPYKMYMSPIAPYLRPERSADYRYQFSRSNDAKAYYQFDQNKVTRRLYELWSNDLVFQETDPNKGVINAPPNFKVVSMNTADPAIPLLLPRPADRENIAQLTNLREFNRDISSDYFNVSALGVTTFLKYFNLDEKAYDVVSYNQDIKLGRDNYVDVTDKAIDARSTLKLLVSFIVERRIEKGRAVLVKREYFKYLEKEKSFSEPLKFNNYLFRTIKVPEQVPDGAYFVKDPTFGTDDYFIPMNECGGTTIIKMPYKGIDVSGEEVDFHMDLMIIKKCSTSANTADQPITTLFFTPANVQTALQALNKRIIDATTAKNGNHTIKLDGKKIFYAPDGSSDVGSGTEQKNTALATDEVQFYSVYNDEYENSYPLIPHLKYAIVKIPQLQALQPAPLSYPVGFTGGYIRNGFNTMNQTKVFVQILKDDITNHLPVISANIIDIIADQNSVSGTIKNIFTQNYKSAGSLVNPDIVIENLSALEQGISLTDEMNSRRSDMTNLRPADILRGVNCEILGGISLLKILKNAIPFDESPILQAVDVAQDGLSVISQYQSEYDRLKQQCDDTLKEIQRLELDLKNNFNNEVKTYIDKYNSATVTLNQLAHRVNDIAVLPTGSVAQQLRTAARSLAAVFMGQIGAAPAGLNLINNELHSLFTDADFKTAMLTILSLKQINDAVQAKIVKINGDKIINKAAFDAFWTDQYTIDLMAKLLLLKFNLQQKILDNGLVNKANKLIKMNLSTKFKMVDGEISRNFAGFKQLVQFHLYTFSIPGNQLDLNFLLTSTGTSDTTLKDLVSLSGSIGLTINPDTLVFSLLDNIDALAEVLTTNAAEFTQASANGYKHFMDAYNEVIINSETYIRVQQTKVSQQLYLLNKQINYAVKSTLDPIWNKVVLKAEAYRNVEEAYETFQTLYLDFNDIKSQAAALESEFNMDLSAFKTTYQILLDNLNLNIKNQLKTRIRTCLTENKYKNIQQDLAVLQAKVTETDFLANIDTLAFEDAKNYAAYFKDVNADVIKQNADLYHAIDDGKQEILNELKAKKQQLQEFTQKIKNFFSDKVKQAEDEILADNQELISAYGQGEQAVNTARRKIDEAQQTLIKLKAINKKEVRYTWNTTGFNDVNFGLLKFICGDQAPTKLSVDVLNTINFDLTVLPPKVKSLTNKTSTELSDFAISFLDILTVSFDHVSFTAGTGIADKFDVAIRDVRFEGPLNFVQIFQSYLKTIDKGLKFDIDAQGSLLGYELCLPDITGGAFNFVNWKLVMSLKLPFKAGVPMQFNFGLNTPQDMGLVSGAVWGGRGCFVIGLEPKRGVVSILLILEVGVVAYVNIGVAEGIVYIFAGIYIRKTYEKVELKGYLTCGGNLDILHLVSMSVTFYMGIQGNGNYMEGYCTLSYEIKIAAFIKISVSLSMYKRIYGCPDNSQRADTPPSQRLRGRTNDHDDENGTSADTINKDIRPNKPKIYDAEWDEFFNANFIKPII